MHERAVFLRLGDQTQVVMERTFGHSSARLWSQLTDPAELPRWLAPGEIELRLGGAARLEFGLSGAGIDSQVTAFEPGRLLEYSWSGPSEPRRPLRWEIIPAGNGCRLRMTLRLPPGEDVARAAAGFEVHLEMLAASLEGAPVGFSRDAFSAARHAYDVELHGWTAA